MPTLVRDEAGNFFVDTGGGVYWSVTADQASTIYNNQSMGKGLVSAVGQSIDNLISGSMSLLSDNPYWLQAYELGRARSEALSLQHGVPAEFAQLIPQMAVLSVLCYAVWLIRKRWK